MCLSGTVLGSLPGKPGKNQSTRLGLSQFVLGLVATQAIAFSVPLQHRFQNVSHTADTKRLIETVLDDFMSAF